MALKFSNCHISDSDCPGVHPIFHPTTFQAFYLDCKKQPKHRKYSEIQKSRSKWGTLILQMKISQVFFTPSAAEHQRAGFSLEYSVWGKFCLSPAPGQSRQQSRIGGSAAQDGIRNPLIQDCSFCSVFDLKGALWKAAEDDNFTSATKFLHSLVKLSWNLQELQSFRTGLRRVHAQVLAARFSFLYTEQNTPVYLVDHNWDWMGALSMFSFISSSELLVQPHLSLFSWILLCSSASLQCFPPVSRELQQVRKLQQVIQPIQLQGRPKGWVGSVSPLKALELNLRWGLRSTLPSIQSGGIFSSPQNSLG